MGTPDILMLELFRLSIEDCQHKLINRTISNEIRLQKRPQQ